MNARAVRLVGRIPVTLMRANGRTLRALWCWATRRRVGAGPGVETIGYTRGTTAVPIAFAVASLVEMGVVHLLVPWPWLRWTLLSVSLYSVLLLAGWIADRIVHPHLVTRDTVVIRDGFRIVAQIARGDLRQCVPRKRFQPTEGGVVDDVLHLPGPDGTEIDIVLDRPIEVLPPALFEHRRRPMVVRRLALHVDDPSAARAVLAAPAQGPSGLSPSARRATPRNRR
ncbi:hypothetical protein [Rhodococcus sp. NPDC047139]|uniref:hypothetical protein n=1 Tax=Rhodococcus sp. NPDC047139 TaxID=3155141 RepID=UPI0033F31E94